MFDVHCHLTDPRIRADADVLIARARGAGVGEMLLAGVDEGDWLAQEELVARHAHVYPCYGLHPQVVAELEESEVRRQLDVLASHLDGPVPPRALGELGLDRAVAAPDTLDKQRGAFREQLAMARSRDLPIVLHILRAQDQALRILEADGVPRAGGFVHSYSGSADLVRRYVRLGLSISFAGPITYANARRAIEAARAVPPERLLVETDAPDQTPEEHRPKANEPAFLPAVLAELARARGESPNDLAELTARNARRLLGITSSRR